jgi:hypothetical protein
MPNPVINIVMHDDGGGRNIVLAGRWTLAAISDGAAALAAQLAQHGDAASATWDCTGIEALDSAWRKGRTEVHRKQPLVRLDQPVQIGVDDRNDLHRAAPLTAAELRSPIMA